jgi:hypothetical protein
MSETSKKILLCAALVTLVADILASGPSIASQKVRLFKVVTVKDHIVIGLNEEQMSRLQSRDAGDVAKALADRGSMTAWQYRVRLSEAGLLEQAPLQPVGLVASDTIRIEPYTSPLRVHPLP